MFSGKQLGVDIYSIDSNPINYLDILGNDNATNLSSDNFQVENSIHDKINYGLASKKPTFILAKDDKGLYFDKDGEDGASPVLVAYIGTHPNSGGIGSFDAGQILLVDSFDHLKYQGYDIV